MVIVHTVWIGYYFLVIAVYPFELFIEFYVPFFTGIAYPPTFHIQGNLEEGSQHSLAFDDASEKSEEDDIHCVRVESPDDASFEHIMQTMTAEIDRNRQDASDQPKSLESHISLSGFPAMCCSVG